MTLIAATELGALVPLLFVLACPLLMVFMMRGHGHSRGTGAHRNGGHSGKTLEELKAGARCRRVRRDLHRLHARRQPVGQRQRRHAQQDAGRRASCRSRIPPHQVEEKPLSETVTYNVPDISCNHCKHSIASEVQAVAGVESVDVDVRAKIVTVVAEPLDEQAIIAAIDQAGYEVVAA